jgi:hypothetical protein
MRPSISAIWVDISVYVGWHVWKYYLQNYMLHMYQYTTILIYQLIYPIFLDFRDWSVGMDTLFTLLFYAHILPITPSWHSRNFFTLKNLATIYFVLVTLRQLLPHFIIFSNLKARPTCKDGSQTWCTPQHVFVISTSYKAQEHYGSIWQSLVNFERIWHNSTPLESGSHMNLPCYRDKWV